MGEFSDVLLGALYDHGVSDPEGVLATVLERLPAAAAAGSQHRRLNGGGTEGGSASDEGQNIALVILCLVCAGAASGLTQGLLSLDIMEMKIKEQSGSEAEKKAARRVLPIIAKHHLLLVTLMLWNAAAMEALPIFLANLVPEWVAIVLSVSLVLVVGEILPAAVLTGPKQLNIASALVPVVYCVMALFFVVAYPISRVLDHLLGHDEGITQYNRHEMVTLVRLQHEEGTTRAGSVAGFGGTSGGGGSGGIGGIGGGGGLSAGAGGEHRMDQEEVTIIEGALTFRNIQVNQVMTPISDAFMLECHERLNYKTLAEIFKAGYSRIPVYDGDPNTIIGLILVKDLIFVDPEDETPIKNFVQLFGRQPTYVWLDDSLGNTLAGFRAQSSHMAMVQEVVESEGAADSVYRNVGIVTLEDIIETILGAEIEDEHDADDARFATGRQQRDFDMARMRLLNSKMADATTSLGEDEVRAVAAHLLSNVKQIQQLFRQDMEAVRELVRRGMLVELKRKSTNAVKPELEDIIYRRGIPTTFCTLVLNGKVTVVAGRDEFSVELGPWSILAADSLISGDHMYSPDFQAHLTSETARVVRLSIYSDFGRTALTRFDALDLRKAELGLAVMKEHAPPKKPASAGQHRDSTVVRSISPMTRIARQSAASSNNIGFAQEVTSTSAKEANESTPGGPEKLTPVPGPDQA